MMNDNEFECFLAQCLEELEQKQSYLMDEFGIGKYERFDIDLQRSIIEFKENSVVKIVASITPVGSYSTNNPSWMWSWANPSIPQVLQKKSEKIKELAELTGLEIFNAKIFPVDEEMAWEIAAMACHHLKSMGCYRAPSGKICFFAAIDNVKTL
ncbi:MAG: hypothetical protein KME17_22470 [Cyanosarcina radialis HA8281-LM2]|jgi:hypothetical protein|nr:hypothetical protein [Cyanosarcina radialis HA8281-LM2]